MDVDKISKTGTLLRDQIRHLAVASLDSRKAVELTLHLLASLLLFSEHSRHCNPAVIVIVESKKVIKLSVVGLFIATPLLTIFALLLVVILFIAVGFLIVMGIQPHLLINLCCTLFQPHLFLT